MSLSRPKPNSAAVSDAYSMGSTAYRADPHQSANHTASASRAAQDMNKTYLLSVLFISNIIPSVDKDTQGFRSQTARHNCVVLI